MNVSEPIRRNAQLAPDAPAHRTADGTATTFAELEHTLDALAHRLRDLGIGPGQVAVCGTEDVYRFLVMALALARIGAVVAPITLPGTYADVAFEEDGVKGQGARRAVPLRDLWPADLMAGGVPPPAALHDDAGATLVYCPSSGTTAGTPKFVPVTHEGMRRRIQIRELTLPVRPGEGQANFVGPASMNGLSGRMRTLWGRGVVLEPNLDAQKLASWFVTSQVEYISISPIGLLKILNVLPAAGVACALKTIEVVGGHLRKDIHELAQRRLPVQMICSYGSTESGPIASAPAGAILGRPGAAGYARAGVEIEVVDADDRPVERGQEGIVRIRSELMATGYLDNPDATANVFRGGWVYPSDIGILEPDGLLRIVGRVDDVINRGGIKIYPGDLEVALMELADLREAAVFSANVGGTRALCAAIVPTAPLDADTFHALCRERLGGKAPDLIVHVRQLPRNAMGKVLRGELERILLAGLRARNAGK